jgi:hypothetical protein
LVETVVEYQNVSVGSAGGGWKELGAGAVPEEV